MRSVDVQALKKEDRASRQSAKPTPPRFGTALDVSLNIQDDGRWTALPDTTGRLWRMRIATQGAQSVNLIFDRFQLPLGGKLFIYNQDKSTVLGAFTAENNKSNGRFSTLPVEGSVITLEYYEPDHQRGNTKLRVSKVVHAYRDLFSQQSGVGTNDFGDSEECQINVNCSEGNNWQDEKRSVAMIINDSGTRICSGALVNNEQENLTPYFLSANHCYDSNVSDWVFWFNYESSSCSNPSSEPGHKGISGATLKARHRDSDFLLVELSKKPPANYNTYYAGWSAKNTPANSSASIHHPQGDIKKISIEDGAAVSDDFNDGAFPSGSHWRVNFDEGVVEKGSSGAPLFDQNHRIVGQLHGNENYFPGADFCSLPRGWYGKFSYSWSRGLSDYLDPNNTGIQTLDGREGPSLAVDITGDPSLDYGELGNWTANASGGTGSYNYDWQYVRSDELGTTYETGGNSPTVQDRFYSKQPNPQDWITVYLSADVTSGVETASETYPVGVYPSGCGGFKCGVVSSDSSSTGTAATRSKAVSMQGPPETFALRSAAPNPFREATRIRYALPEAAHVQLTVYDMMGREVARVVDKKQGAGYHNVSWSGDNLPSGVYVYRLQASGFAATKRVVLLK